MHRSIRRPCHATSVSPSAGVTPWANERNSSSKSIFNAVSDPFHVVVLVYIRKSNEAMSMKGGVTCILGPVGNTYPQPYIPAYRLIVRATRIRTHCFRYGLEVDVRMVRAGIWAYGTHTRAEDIRQDAVHEELGMVTAS